MKVILLSNGHRESRTFELGRWTRVLVIAAVLALPTTLGLVVGASLNGGDGAPALASGLKFEMAGLSKYRDKLAAAEKHAEKKVQVLTLKLAQLQARIVRLDAVGERVAELVGLDKGEFNFGRLPPVGGPEQPGQAVEQAEIRAMFRDLENQLDDREQQLNILKDMMGDREVKRESTVAGQPVNGGWMSSRFGRRTDPFNGRTVWHKGVDFAGKEGSDIIAVAAGLVTRSETYKGFGRMVEVDHGDGLVTRYAHNRENLVSAGDMVKKGQVIALMGNTGRSTGPHVHFAVYKDGKAVNPAKYIRRTTL